MLSELGRSIRAYVALVAALPEFDDWLDAENALVHRDGIQERIDAGQQPTERERQALAEADARLAELRPHLAARFPRLFEPRPDVPPEYWWWHERGSPSQPGKLTAGRR